MLRSHLWLPFTQMQSFDASARTFVRADGTTLVDARGQHVYDAVSSIWTTVHGHAHPRIVEAIARQARTLDHATTLGASNPCAEDLARELCALTGLDYAFFASDGASAIEAALKMALQYWQNVGEPRRTRFVRLVDAYHGDTTGAMSLSDIAPFRSRFGAITFDSIPYESRDRALAADVAAIVVEPLVQAAAGMRSVAPERYAGLRDRDTLLIVDEIATGFGRTGTLFACEQLDLRPDMICVGKGITGGTLALSATVVRAPIYDSFLGEPTSSRQFFHGHSYAGNPIACAAALASLACFHAEQTLAHVGILRAQVEQRLAELRENSAVRATSGVGLMVGVELNTRELRRDDAPSAAWRVANGLYKRGHFTRPIGDVIQFVPPLSSRADEIDGFFDALESELSG